VLAPFLAGHRLQKRLIKILSHFYKNLIFLRQITHFYYHLTMVFRDV